MMPSQSASLGARVSSISWDRSRNAHFPSLSRLGSQSQPRRALFLDRDGVLIDDVGFLREISQIRVLPGVQEFLEQAQAGFCLIVVTNQSGVARGYFSEDDLRQIHLELVKRLAALNVYLDALYYCPHLPGASVSVYDRACQCRKPLPGMLIQAAADWGLSLKESYMVGDSPRDTQAGEAAGVRSFLVGPSTNDNMSSSGQHISGLMSLLPILNQASAPDSLK